MITPVVTPIADQRPSVVATGVPHLGPPLSPRHGRPNRCLAAIHRWNGLTFYTGEPFPHWKRNVFVGGLREGRIPETGQLQRIVFNARWEELRREPMLMELKERIRDVR